MKLPTGTHPKATSSTPPSSAGLVQHFVCSMVGAFNVACGMLERLRARRRPETSMEHPLCLVSSPGFAVLDSGCGKSIIGKDTLEKFRVLWSQAGVPQPQEKQETNVFRFGNGAQETSNTMIEMPVNIAGKDGIVRAAVIQGDAPLLLSRPALKVLNAQMNFARDELVLFDQKTVIPMKTNEAGQYIVPVASFAKTGIPAEEPQVVALADPDPELLRSHAESPTPQDAPDSEGAVADDTRELSEDGTRVCRIHKVPRQELFTPSKEGCPVPICQLGPKRITKYSGDAQQPMARHVDEWTDKTCAHRTADPDPELLRSHAESPTPQDAPDSEGAVADDTRELSEDGTRVCRIHRVPRQELFTPSKEGCPVPICQLGPKRITKYSGDAQQPMARHVDEWTDKTCAHRTLSEKAWTGVTTFEVLPPPPSPCPEEALLHEWSAKQMRNVRSCARAAAQVQKPSNSPPHTMSLRCFLHLGFVRWVLLRVSAVCLQTY